MRAELIQKIMNIISKEGYSNIKIGKEKNNLFEVTIRTNKNNNINFEADENEVEVLKRLLDINSETYTDEGEIDDDVSKTEDEIDSIYKQWAEYIEQIDDGEITDEQLEVLEMEIKVFEQKIRILKRQIEILNKEKKGIRTRKLIKELNEENNKQQTMMIFHELMLNEYKKEKEKKKTQTQAPTQAPTKPM
jgi:hypothetical protein